MSLSADLVIRNARIFTAADGARASAHALAVANGRIVAMSHQPEEHLEDYIGEATVVEDLDGAAVLPGLVDVHTHLLPAGKAMESEVQFPIDASVAEILAAVREWASALPEDAWVIGGSWGSTLLKELSTAEARQRLDEAVQGRAAVLSDDSYHNVWVSTEALRRAGIPISPQEGELPEGAVTDRAAGETAGVLMEGAVGPVRAAAEAGGTPSPQDWVRYATSAWRFLNSLGVTAVQEAVVHLDGLLGLAQLDAEGTLTGRVVCSLNFTGGMGPALDEQAARQLHEAAVQAASDDLRTDWVKIFLDGVPPTQTAAFIDPYLPSDEHGHDHRGAVYFAHDELVAMFREYAQQGRSVKAHCTGDQSVRSLLDAVEALRAEGQRSMNFQIAHGQFVAPEDMQRMRTLDVIADASPFLWYPGIIPTAIADVLPEDRAARMQPVRDLIDLGVLVAGGSDWPVSPTPNLWEGMAGLVTRQDPRGRFPGSLWAEQAVSVAEAIRAFTINGARAAGLGETTGSLEIGKSADFIAIDRSPFDVAPEAIAETAVQRTWFKGEPVYSR